MIINTSYFIGELSVANAFRPEQSEVLNAFIIEYETKFLELVLGYDLYDALKEDLAASERTPRMQKLLNGTMYTVNGQSRKWNGLKQSNMLSEAVSVNTSIIANYVYYWYMRNNITQTSGVGEVANTVENSQKANPDLKLARAYNKIIPEVRTLTDYLNNNQELYPEWNTGKWYVYANFDLWSPINLVF